MIRAVVDSSVLVSAFIGDPEAGPGRLITAWRDRRFVIVVSPLLLDELTDVLGRPKFERWSSQGRGRAYIAALRARSELRSDVPPAQPIEVRDPDDHYLVALSREAEVDYLVSVDRDLLDAELDLPVVDPAMFVAGLHDPVEGEHFFTGTTQAGRELRLYYQGTIDDPMGVTITGTLDGAAIGISGITQRMAKGADSSVIVRSDQGTFTAVADPDAPAAAHSAALRLYMERRPSGGWRTEVERSVFEDGEWRFDVSVTNDRVSAAVELRMSDAVAKTWTDGARTASLDQMVAEHVAVVLRNADWSAIRQRALHPRTVLGGRLRR
ncbi:MAG: putative toxin-antitoxin system toxin component, PIN family [Solirubrobacteraceae bacterium]